MSPERERSPQPTGPGYGDQGPAGGGRDPADQEHVTQDEDEDRSGLADDLDD
jgi:hypothetical protein